MRVGVISFPGSLDDVDAARAVRLAGGEPVPLWHADHRLPEIDAVVLPGGFSYGDYLRCGAIARFAPVMRSVAAAAADGTPVLGICNGFQILCEARLLPGALTHNQHRRFRNRDQWLRVETAGTAWTNGYEPGQQILVPVKSGQGCYVADEATLDALAAAGRVVASYLGDSPNGSARDIAAVCNEAGNVVGVLPHPEHAVDPLTGASTDGIGFFTSVLKHLAQGATHPADTTTHPPDTTTHPPDTTTHLAPAAGAAT